MHTQTFPPPAAVPPPKCSYAPASAKGTEGADAILDHEPFCAVASEQAMWRAVIVQALMDAACGSRKEEALQWKRDADIWLRGNSKDFWTLLECACGSGMVVR